MSESSDLILNIIAKDKASKEIAKTGLAIAAAAAVIVEFGKKSVAAYSEAEQAESKLVTAYNKFGAVHDVTLKSLNDLAAATEKKTVFDHTQVQSAEAVLATFKLTGKQIETLIPLAADYAGKTGIDLVTASQNLGKAFVGNTRALKLIGINFHATGNTAKDFATIMADLNAKVGGFEAGQKDTAAFKAAQLQHEFQLLQEQVGSLLVPALKTLADVITPVVEDFNKLSPPVKNAAVIISVVGAVALVAVPKITAMKAALLELGIGGTTAATALEGTAAAEGAVGTRAGGIGALAGKLGILALALTAVGAGFRASGLNKFASSDVASTKGLLGNPAALKDALDKVHTAHGSLASSSNKLGNALQGTFVQAPASILNTFGAGITGPFDAAKQELAGLDKQFTALVKGGHAKDAAAQFAQVASTAKSLGWSTKDVNTQFGGYLKAIGPVGTSTNAASAAVQSAADQLSALNVAAAKATHGLFSLYQTSLGGKISADQWKDSLVNLTDTIKGNGKTLDDNTTKGRANREAILGQVDSLVQSTDAAVTNAIKTGQGMDKIAPKYQAQWKAIEAAGIKAGLSKTQVDHLIGAYKNVPASVTTVINQTNIDAALRKARDLFSLYQAMGISKAGGAARPKASPSRLAGGRAAGGPVSAGLSYIVGEKAPEIFTPSSSGYVTSNSKIGVGSTHIGQIVINTKADPQEVVRAIQKFQRANGQGWQKSG